MNRSAVWGVVGPLFMPCRLGELWEGDVRDWLLKGELEGFRAGEWGCPPLIDPSTPFVLRPSFEGVKGAPISDIMVGS